MKRLDFILKNMSDTRLSRQVSAAPSNKKLQATFDPLPTFAAAKAVIGSNAAERGR